MLGRGRLRGFSHYWAFGSPSDEIVSFGGELWVAAFRALTLGQPSWLRTYSIAFFGFLIFKSLSLFWFARRYFGAGAAIVCAWLATLEPGGMLEGSHQGQNAQLELTLAGSALSCFDFCPSE